METTTKSSAINYGLYLGGIASLATILAYAIKLELFTSITFGIGLFVIAITIGAISILKSKKIQNGFITFKEAFTSYFITILVGLIISTVVSFVLFNFIDPDAAVQLKELALNSQVEMLRNFNQPEETIAMVVEASENSGNLFSLKNVLITLVTYLVIYILVGLLVALILKRNPEQV